MLTVWNVVLGSLVLRQCQGCVELFVGTELSVKAEQPMKTE